MLLAPAADFAAQSPPLPGRDTFFAEVRSRLASNDLIQSRFTYRERSTELKLNPFGRFGTGPILVHEIYPHPNDDLTYRRLVERDGEALDDLEIARQDRDYRKRLSDWQHRIAREGNSEREHRLRKAEEAREKDTLRAQEALEMFDFVLAGRDTWEGEPAIVISFSPRPGARPRSREGRVAHAFAGRAWVHEHEFEVMKVEATAVDDVSFGLGLIAKLHKGSTARFLRRRIAGAWLPVETRFEGTGRALLVRKVDIRFSRDYSDYRPFEPAELPALLGWER
jgi:hypothetical protein